MKKSLLYVLLLILLPFNGFAETSEEKGLQIAQEEDRRDSGWRDQIAVLRMVLRNSNGDESLREIRSRNLEVNDDGDKSLIVFDAPADVKGTALLSFSHGTEPDDQWLYLPALKRVKRISSSNKSGPFMGSEFAYEDISSQEVDKYSYKYIGDDVVDGKNTFVIERYPQYNHSGYTRQVVWLEKQIYQPLKINFYDRKNELLKTLTYYEYKQYLDKYWRPARMEMVNHQTGKATTLSWSEYKFKNGLSESDFNRSSLKRAR